MYKLRDFVLSSSKPVYIRLSDDETAKCFLNDAEEQGFIFCDGKKPTEKEASSFFALHSDMTMNYIGAIGRMAYQCGSENIVRLVYKDFIEK